MVISHFCIDKKESMAFTEIVNLNVNFLDNSILFVVLSGQEINHMKLGIIKG